ncbi:MAG: leucyl aminopeptidase [Candidatus Paceibacteria bacterium]
MKPIKFIFKEYIKEKNVDIGPGKESLVVLLPGKKKQIKIGIGEPEKLNRRKLILIFRQIISLAKTNKIKDIALLFSDFKFPQLKISDEDIAELMATNFEMANFEFIKFKSPPQEGWNFVKNVIIAGKITNSLKQAFRKGQVIGQEVNSCRAWANTPGGALTPKLFAKEAANVLKNAGVRCRVLGKNEMKKLKMGAILGVAEGSEEEPQFVIAEYFKAGNEKPVVLVGKGVTFDTGGLNIKPEGSMYEMHLDMSGGAAVISTLALVSKLKLKKNVVGLVPLVENMPSGSSFRPGDILKSMSGKTIEVLNTDAEGRIILADALNYAKKYQPKLVIDVATLTGAAIVALGKRASAIFTKDENLERLFRDAGEESGDYVWPLPMWEEYEEEIKGTFGDVANMGKYPKEGGAITGAVFLWQFAKEFPAWVHIDIAPRMTVIDGEYLAKGAAGAPVRLLIKILERV